MSKAFARRAGYVVGALCALGLMSPAAPTPVIGFLALMGAALVLRGIET